MPIVEVVTVKKYDACSSELLQLWASARSGFLVDFSPSNPYGIADVRVVENCFAGLAISSGN